MSSQSKARSDLFYVALFLGLLIFTLGLEVWLAQRLSLWGDEIDTMMPAFRPWRGDHSFWWQIGQYNANPPGDNLVLRLYLESGALKWLRGLSQELYWRLPYIMVFAATVSAAFAFIWKWTGRSWIGLLAALILFSSTGLLTYAIEVRFYIWQVFFLLLSFFGILFWMEEPSSFRRLGAASLLTTLGVCFHVVLAAPAYLLLALATGWAVCEVWRWMAGARHPKQLGVIALHVVIGFLPFAMYKVELKHWLFIPPPAKNIKFWDAIAGVDVRNVFALISANLPMPEFWSSGGLTLWFVLLVLGFVAAVVLKKYTRAVQVAVLGVFSFGVPAAVAVMSTRYGYGLLPRHFLSAGAALALCVAFGLHMLFGTLKPGDRRRRPEAREGNARRWIARSLGARPVMFIGAGVFVWLTIATGAAVSEHVLRVKDQSPSKVPFPFLHFRTVYRMVPDPRELLVVGASPKEMVSDEGSYTAAIQGRYLDGFAASYFSTKGSFDSKGAITNDFARAVAAKPGRFDYLLIGDAGFLKHNFPALPWHTWRCHVFETGTISFCRVP